MKKTYSPRVHVNSMVDVSSPGDYVALPFERRYEQLKEKFPGWLLSEPIAFPRDHPTFGWACRVSGCGSELAHSNAKFLCAAHDREYRQVSSEMRLSEFVYSAKPYRNQGAGWALARYKTCRVCGPGREGYHREYCMAHAGSLDQARRRGQSEESWLSTQTPLDAYPPCSIQQCVHDGALWAFRGPGEQRICRTHRSGWVRHLNDKGLRADANVWGKWSTDPYGKGITGEEERGNVTLAHLPERLQCEVRYAAYQHAKTPRRSHWRPRYLQIVIDELVAMGVQTLSDPVLSESADTAKHPEIRRIWQDLPFAARSVTVTAADAKEAGWFDPVLVGADPFVDSQGGANRKKIWNIRSVSQRWLRDLLWDYIEYLALEAEGKRPSTGTVYQRIRSARMLSKALRQLREDEGNDPTLLDASDARAFKDLWDFWYKEQLDVIEKDWTTPPKLGPLSTATRTAFTNGMRHLLVFGRQRDILDPSIDSFVLNLPHYPRAKDNPYPRPLSEADFRLLVSEESLALLDAADPGDVGLSDIWMTHAFQGGRISETLRLRLGCVSMIGDAQPYLWRDVAKAKIVDYGMPCYYPVYERLVRRQDKTRQLLRERYAKEIAGLDRRGRAKLEAEWDKTMPLFPGPVKNPDLSLPLSQCHFIDTVTAWIEQLGLEGVNSHRTRATLATSLLDNGASPELVRQVLGQISEGALAHYARYSDETLVRHLHRVWTAGPGMDEPGKVLMTPAIAEKLGSPKALTERIDLTVVPVEHGLCRYGPVVGGANCPRDKNCSNGKEGPCPHFVLTGADLTYWERKRDAAYHFAEGAPSNEARDYILSEWKPWETVLSGLRQALDELDLLEAAETLDLRTPLQDFYHPLFTTGWQLPGNSSANTHTREKAK